MAFENAHGCPKKRFDSVVAARRAHRKAHYRIRVYHCEYCAGYHVTNNEKRHHQDREDE